MLVDLQTKVSPVASSPLNNAWDRPISPNTIKVSGKGLVGRDKLEVMLEKMLGEIGLKMDSVSLFGPPVSRGFKLKFLGAEGVAQHNMESFYTTLKNGDDWIEFFISDPEGVKVQISFGPDKGPKMVKTEISTKRMQHVLEEMYPNHKFYANKRLGSISWQWKELVQIKVGGPESTTVMWHKGTIGIATFIDKEAVSVAFQAASGGRASLEWCL